MKNRQMEWQLLDKFRRQFFLKHEVKKGVWQAFLNNNHLSLKLRYGIKVKKTFLMNFATLTRHRNRCVISGRQYNVISKTHYSRFVLRREAYIGHLPGVARFSR